VIYKIGERAQAVIEMIRRHGLAQNARLVCYAEQEREQIFTNLDDLNGNRLGYMSTMIVHVGHKSWS
jgi:precorrin-2 methylase